MIVPNDGYFKQIRDICTKYNVLMIADEVQTGLGRTGKLMCHEWDLKQHNLKPDIITLGKALSGGVTPVSGIMADDAIMSALGYGDHGSTYGGNPLAMAITRTALEVIVEEGLVENA